MKRLYLLRSTRHRAIGLSSLEDYHRPLSRRGEISAINMGRIFRKHGYIPDLVICATTTRTRQTLANVWPDLLDATGKAPKAIYDYHMHLMRGEALIARLREVEDHYDRVLIVGIAPGISDLAQLLNQPKAQLPDPFEHGMPMGGLAVFDCNIVSWTDLAPACNELIQFIN